MGTMVFPVGEGQNGHLRPGQELLHHHPGAALPEDLVLHQGADRLPGLLTGLADEDALAQGQAVGLHHRGQGAGLHIGQGGFRTVKYLVGGGGDAVAPHQVLGKHFAALDGGGVLRGAEAEDPGGLQSVHRPQHQGIVGGHHGEIHRVGPHELHNGGDVLGADGHALGVGGDAAVAGQGVDGLRPWVLLELLNDGVFAASAANDQNVHVLFPFPVFLALSLPPSAARGGFFFLQSAWRGFALRRERDFVGATRPHTPIFSGGYPPPRPGVHFWTPKSEPKNRQNQGFGFLFPIGLYQSWDISAPN